jgi:hypothetical protein
MQKIKCFNYTKPDGETSPRLLWVLGEPSDSYFGLDLSQFPKEEREYYIQELQRVSDMMKVEISELGLDSCYRRFKEDRIS